MTLHEFLVDYITDDLYVVKSMYNNFLCILHVCKTCNFFRCDYSFYCSCYSEENKNCQFFNALPHGLQFPQKSDVWIATTLSVLMQIPHFTYHFNSLNLLFKAISN